MNNTTSCEASVIYVHYKTPELLSESVAAVELELSTHSLIFEILIVDNSNSLKQSEFSNTHVSVITKNKNIGYAAGINFGVESSKGKNLIILNPDVVPHPDCLMKLIMGLDKFDLTAPNLFLDDEYCFRLPPQEPINYSYFLLKKLSNKYNYLAKFVYFLWRRHVEQYWGSECDSAGYDMSGAILAFTRNTYNQVGRWDESFFLYYEETDWLLRLKQSGLNAGYLVNAMAVHHYSQSMPHNRDSDKYFSQSEKIFLRKHFNKIQIKLLGLIEKIKCSVIEKKQLVPYQVPITPMWLELSYSPAGFPAARAFIQNPGDFKNGLPDVIRKKLHTSHYYLQWFNNDGELFSRGKFIIQ